MSQRDFNTDRDLSILEEHVEALHAALRMQAEGALKLVGACRDLDERLKATNKRLEALEERVQRLEDRLCATIRKPGSETS